MIEKMEFLRITGPKEDFDRVTEHYLMKYDVHLENAMMELSSVQDLKPFVEVNPYRPMLNKLENVITRVDSKTEPSGRDMTKDEILTLVTEASEVAEEYNSRIEELRSRRKQLKTVLTEIEPFRLLDYDLSKILNFHFIKFRFGKIAHEYYNKFSKYVYENLNTVFYECDRDNSYVWGVYFVPAGSATKVDAIFASLHFEKVYIPSEYTGKPEEIYRSIRAESKQLSKQSKELKGELKDKLMHLAPDLLQAKDELERLNENFDIRKMAACTKEKSRGQVFYILCGWMSRQDAHKFVKEIEEDSQVFCIDDDDMVDSNIMPPTKLRNLKIFKPFEMFIRMYGMPAYNEMDPTLFVALTYTLMFGIMFGDVGQGLCLLIGGLLIYKIKKMNLAAIISIAGVWSTFFGFMYGSLFGYEDVIKATWMRPMENIMSTLITAVIFGVVLILIAMVLHIINAIKAKDIEGLLLDPSGISGLICYGTVAVAAGLMFTGHKMPATILLVIFIGVPLLAIFLKEPLGNLLKRKKEIFPAGGKGMFFIEAFVELFDVVLSYATNTISFVRVGAFALSHAGMMGVVFTLAGANNGNTNMVVVILGNILVAGLEGLVVGIQVLRLEYYEMFSRFYKGTGKEFKPYRKKI